MFNCVNIADQHFIGEEWNIPKRDNVKTGAFVAV